LTTQRMVCAHLLASQPAEKVVSIGFRHACSFSMHHVMPVMAT
jgi:hypothetical protein